MLSTFSPPSSAALGRWRRPSGSRRSARAHHQGQLALPVFHVRTLPFALSPPPWGRRVYGSALRRIRAKRVMATTRNTAPSMTVYRALTSGDAHLEH